MTTSRKQTLPKELWTFLAPGDKATYCFWYVDGHLKKCKVPTVNKARDFVKEAEQRNVGAFASTFVEEVSENQVFECSFKDVLKKYETKDWVRLEIASANYKLLNYPAKKAKRETSARSVEQWSEKNYNLLYSDATYHVSWYNTEKHRFEERTFAKYEEADTEFTAKKTADIPVRLTECLNRSHKIHEVKAACQHWHIGMGTYLEQLAKKTLPVGEIPYTFSNSYMASELEVEKGDQFGYLKFHVGFDRFVIQIGRTYDGASIMVDTEFGCNMISWTVVQDNPIMEPWLAKIDRGW